MNNKDSIIEIYICYFTMFSWFIWSITIIRSGRITVKGAVLEGWLLYGFVIFMNIIFLVQGNSILKYLIEKSNSKITKKIIIKEFLKSPFFVMFIMILVYQNFSYGFFNLSFLIILYVLFFIAQYFFIKKMENYNVKH
jgi:hypothetical protein